MPEFQDDQVSTNSYVNAGQGLRVMHGSRQIAGISDGVISGIQALHAQAKVLYSDPEHQNKARHVEYVLDATSEAGSVPLYVPIRGLEGESDKAAYQVGVDVVALEPDGSAWIRGVFALISGNLADGKYTINYSTHFEEIEFELVPDPDVPGANSVALVLRSVHETLWALSFSILQVSKPGTVGTSDTP